MAHQFPFIDTDHSQAANTIANLRADYAQFGVDSSVNLNLAGVGTFSNTVSFGATVNVTGTLVDDSTQVGAAGSILSSTGSGIRWVPAGEGNTASASNVGTNANATNAEQWLTFVGANSSNNPIRVDDDLRYNPSTNILTTGGVDLGNNRELRFGDDQALIIKHFNPGHSYIQQGAGKGDLVISTAKLRIVNAADDEDLANFTEGLSAHLYFAGTERIRTADGGVVVTGICTATTFSGALTGDVTGNTSGSSGSCTGNAATATALQNARTIGGTSFDGTANINPGVAEGLTGTPSIDVTNIDIAGTLTDKNDAVGTSGQILTSTEDGVAWASVGDQADKVAVANEAVDTTCFPVFGLTATGSEIELKSNTAFKFNSATGELEASKFAISSGTSNQFLKGDGSVDTTTYLSSIADNAVTYAKMGDISTNRLMGRITAGDGDPETLTPANVRTIINVADGAEVNVQSDWTQATNTADDFIKNKPTLVTAFTGLSDTPGSLTASKFVKVNAAGNALEFGDDNNTNTFTGLTDTPANYTGHGSKLVGVNAAGNGLEYVAAGTGADVDTFLELTDTPGTFTASKFVKVKADASGLEFVDDPNTNTTYDLLVPELTTAIRLDPSSGTDDDITITGGTNVTVTRTSGTELTFSSVNTTYGAVSTSAAGLAPTLPAAHGGKFLKGDATWEVPPDTTYGVVSSSANGLAPQLPATHGDKFLKADGSWEVPAYTTNTNTTYGISCADGDNADEEKIRLTGANPTTTDDIVLEAGTGLSIARDGDKITFTNTISDTNTNTTYDLSIPENTTDIRLAGSDSTNDDITLTGGTNVTVTRTSGTEFTLSSTNTTYGLFTTSANGLAPQLPASHGGKFLKADGSWAVPAYTTDTNTFTGLTDTPANYTDSGSKLVAVKSDASGLEYVAAGTGADVDAFLELTDTPNSFTANKVVKVNATGNALVFGDDNNSNTTYDLSVEQTGGNDDNPILRLDPSSGTNDDITITGGTNVTVTRNSGTELTISSVNTTYGVVSSSANGLAPQMPASHGGKFLKADGNWEVPAYNTSLADKIVEGNTSVEVVDSGTNGHIILTTEGAEAVRVDKDGFMGIGIQDPMDILHLHKGGDGVTNVGMILTHSTSGDSSSSDDGIHMYLSGTAASIDNFEGGGVTIRPDGATNGNVSITTSGTTFQSSVTASSLVKSGGTAAQFLKANGTVDSNTYSTTSHTHTYQVPLTFSTGITNTSNTVTVDAAVQTTVAGSGSNTNVFTIDTIALNSFRLLEYTIHVRHSTGIQAQKLLVMCDGTNHHHSEYGVMYSAALLGTFSTSTSGSNVLVRFDPVNTSTTIDFIKQVVTT